MSSKESQFSLWCDECYTVITHVATFKSIPFILISFSFLLDALIELQHKPPSYSSRTSRIQRMTSFESYLHKSCKSFMEIFSAGRLHTPDNFSSAMFTLSLDCMHVLVYNSRLIWYNGHQLWLQFERTSLDEWLFHIRHFLCLYYKIVLLYYKLYYKNTWYSIASPSLNEPLPR